VTAFVLLFEVALDLAALPVGADAAAEHPLICLLDDEQWLDHASAQVLGFVARRLVAESVALIFAARVPSDELAPLPELVVEGLREADARTLLDATLTGPLDAQIRAAGSPSSGQSGSRGPGTRPSRHSLDSFRSSRPTTPWQHRPPFERT
jgi:hypothetical protein